MFTNESFFQSKSSKSGTSKRSSKSGKSKKSSKSKKSYKSGSRKVVSAKPVPKRSRRSSKSKSQSRSKTSDDASSQARKSKTTKTAKPVRVVQQQAAAPKVDLAAPKVDHAAQQRRQHEENQKAIARAEEVRAAACVAAQRDVVSREYEIFLKLSFDIKRKATGRNLLLWIKKFFLAFIFFESVGFFVKFKGEAFTVLLLLYTTILYSTLF